MTLKIKYLDGTYDIQKISELIKNQSILSIDLVKVVLEKINNENKIYNSFVTIMKESALNRAQILDEELKNGKYRGQLHGIPVALKDNVFVKNVRTTMGSKVYGNF